MFMNYVQSEMLHLFHLAPGTLESVTYQPDILSVVISWEAPAKEEGYITKVTLRYYNSEGVELGSVNVNNGERTYRYVCNTRREKTPVYNNHSSKGTVPL